jgi:hypothetical protein
VSIVANRTLNLRRVLLAGLIWLVALGLVYVLLFPGMWVDPIGTLRSVYSKAALRVSWAHPNPVYFLGQSSVGDPGPAYYPLTLAHKLTGVVSIFALVALAGAALVRDLPRRQRFVVALTLAFACFFTLQMTLGAKKQVRYLLPAFPAVDILAGVGAVWWARWMGRLQDRRGKLKVRGISTALIALALIVQAALVLPRHPYYDTYFNELAGGARAGVAAISTQWQGEGLDLAARELNELPDAERLTVGSHKAVMLRQYFVGQTVDVDAEADWYALGISNILAGGEDPENRLVDRYLRREAWDTIRFDGIPYVLVYPAAAGPQNPVAFTFEEGIQLIGYDIPSSPLHPGETLRLQLYWRAFEPLAEDYNVFVHLLTGPGAGQLVAQQDNPPQRGQKPTSSWKPGQEIPDPYDLPIPADALPGEYTLAVGLYGWPDLARLPVRDNEGLQLPDQRILLTKVRVEREPFPTLVWIARGVAVLVLLSAGVRVGTRDA